MALADARLADHDAQGDTSVKQEVAELGRRLYSDRLGPIEFYPTCTSDRAAYGREPGTSSRALGEETVDLPASLVLRLQSTLEGCEWLLGEWASLKDELDRGQPWTSPDKLKAVRLLGKQPVDAIDDEQVALVFLASFVLNPEMGKWYWEILMELNDDDTRRFRKNAAIRQLGSLKPANAAVARQALKCSLRGQRSP